VPVVGWRRSDAIRAINEQLPPGGGRIDGGDISDWSFTASGLWGPNTSGTVGFYLKAGIGADYVDVRLKETALIWFPPVCDPWWGWCRPGGVGPGSVVVKSDAQWAFAWNVGIGLTFEMMSGSHFFIEATYRSIETDPQRAEALVASGDERAEEFSMARLADLYLERYERLLTRARS